MSQLAAMNLKEKENVSEKMEKFSLKVSQSDKKLLNKILNFAYQVT